jgi:hypothetical protein
MERKVEIGIESALYSFYMSFFLGRFLEFSAVGLICSVLVHVLGLFGRRPPFGYFVFSLQFGAVVSAIGAAFAVVLLLSSRGENFWKAAFRAGPRWMIWMTYFLIAYAIFNFIVFVNRIGHREGLQPDQITAIVLRGISGEWMVFYSGALLIFSSAIRILDLAEE